MKEFKYELVEDIKLERSYEFGKRSYTTPEGNKYPSVTTVLGQLSASGIQKWRDKVGDVEADRISKESSTVGTAMHELCENYLLGQELSTKNEQATGLFNLLKPKLDQIEAIHGIEVPLYSDYLMMAGTADLVATYNGMLCIIDFKNARKEKKEEWIDGYYLQGTTYARMFFERYGIFPSHVVIWIAVWDGTFQEFIIPTKDMYARLKAIVKVWHPFNQK